MALSTSRTLVTKTGISTTQVFDMGGINIPGGDFNLGNTIKLGNASGIITATSFVGSGANLTSIPAANLTGTLPAISGANLTSLPAQATIANNADNRVITGGSGVNLNGEANLTFDGNHLTLNTSSSSSRIYLTSGNSDDSSIYFGRQNDTATGGIRYDHSDNSLRLIGYNNAERLRITSDGKIGIAHHVAGQIAKELTIRPANDGGIRFVRPGETSASPNIHLDLTTTTSGSAFPSGEAYTVKYKTMNCDQIFETYAGGGTGGNISFRTSTSNNSSESLRITSTGNLEKKRGGSYFAYNVNGYYAKQDNYDNSGGKSYWYDGASGNSNIVAYVDGQSGDIMAKGNFVAGTAGKGIDFSATSGGSGGSSEILSDYEQGTFTATVTSSGGGASFASGSQATNCIYIKIGSMVHIQGYLSGVNVSSAGSGITKITGLPFASNNTSYYTISLTHNTLTAQQCTGAYIQYANTYFFPIQIGSTSGSALNQGNPRYMMFGGSYPVQF